MQSHIEGHCNRGLEDREGRIGIKEYLGIAKKEGPTVGMTARGIRKEAKSVQQALWLWRRSVEKLNRKCDDLFLTMKR